MNLMSCVPGTTAIFDSLLFVIYMGTNRQYGMHTHYVVVSESKSKEWTVFQTLVL